MGAPQEHDPTRRRLIFRDLPLLVGGLTLIVSGCQTEPEEETPFTTLEPTEPLKLPPEPEDGILKIKEILQKPGGYIYGEVIGSVSYQEHPEIRGYPSVIVPKIAIYHVKEGTGEKRLLSRDIGDQQIRYYNFSMSPDGGTVVLAFEKSEEGGKTLNVKIVEITSGEERFPEKNSFPVGFNVFPDSRDSYVSSNFQWSHDSRYLASYQSRVIWDTKTGRVVYLEKEPTEFLWSPKENKVLVADLAWDGSRKPLTILDIADGGDVKTTLLEQFRSERIPSPCEECFTVSYETGSGLGVSFAEWSPDGERLAIRRFSWKKDHAIHLVNKKGQVLKTFSFDSPVNNLVWSPDSKYLAFFMNKGMDFWEDYQYKPHLVLLDVETEEQVIIPTIREPKVTGDVFEKVKPGGFMFWTKGNILVMVAPYIYPAPAPVQPFEKILFLPAEELLGGRINIVDNKLGSGQAVLVNGYVRMTKPHFTDRMDSLALEISQPKGLSGDLNKVNPNTGRIEFIRKGIGMTSRIETVEKETIIGIEGDIAISESGAYRLLNKRKYPIQVPLEVFKRRSDFRGLIRAGSAQSLKDIPEGTIAPEPFILDWAGFLRRNNENGGLKIVYGPGLLTKTVNLDEDISLDKTFPEIREYLKEQNQYREEDNLYLGYRRGMFGYRRRDTMQDPLQSIALFSQFLKEFKEAHPLDNFNLICHSLGGVIALHAAYRHLEVINNIITIDSPLRGVPLITDEEVRQQLLSLVGEKVINFLLQAWKSAAYQKRIKEIATKAQARGIGVYTFASTDDLIVPWQSAFIEGATNTISGQRIDLVFPMGKSFRLSLNPFSFFDFGHGTPLENPKILGYIAKIVSQNLATVT